MSYDLPKPIDPIKGIIDLFSEYSLVAISEGVSHGDEQGHAFIRSLISDPRFLTAVDDIVVEWGNSLYQAVLNQYIDGCDVSSEELRKVWQNTTQPHDVWDKPVYEEFFKTVRDINRINNKKLRVLLGDPPIDWDEIRSNDDFRLDRLNRVFYPSNLIHDKVINCNRRALIIYGGMHLQRNNLFANYEETDDRTLVGMLENKGHKIFTIWGATDIDKLDININSWKIPALIMLRNTVLGATDFTWYYPHDVKRRININGKIVYINCDKVKQLPMENQFDAIMYYGDSSLITYSHLLPSTCTDEYIKMRIKRMTIFGFPQIEIERKRKFYQELAKSIK